MMIGVLIPKKLVASAFISATRLARTTGEGIIPAVVVAHAAPTVAHARAFTAARPPISISHVRNGTDDPAIATDVSP
jgi:hypothetical protein